MTGASETLDPIMAAERGIAGSKDLIAAVARDLGQHQRWLAHYRVAEKRHARRVMLQELIYQVELRRQRLMRFLIRLALKSFRMARSIAAFLARASLALFLTIRHLATACAAWLRPRAYALALTVRIWLVAFWVWSLTTSRILARGAVKYASLALAWLALRSRDLANRLEKGLAAAWSWTLLKGGIIARASLKGASAGAAWTAAKSLSLAVTLGQWLAIASSWARPFAAATDWATKATVSARNSVAAASAGYSWGAFNLRTLSHSVWRAAPQAGTAQQALVVRRCTALICFEPRRAGLPAIRTG